MNVSIYFPLPDKEQSPFSTILCFSCLAHTLLKSELNCTDSLNFRRLMDYKQRLNREWVTPGSRRMLPKTWGKFASALLVMKIWLFKKPIHCYTIQWSIMLSPWIDRMANYSRMTPRRLYGENPLQEIGLALHIGQIKQAWTNKIMNN